MARSTVGDRGHPASDHDVHAVARLPLSIEDPAGGDLQPLAESQEGGPRGGARTVEHPGQAGDETFTEQLGEFFGCGTPVRVEAGILVFCVVHARSPRRPGTDSYRARTRAPDVRLAPTSATFQWQRTARRYGVLRGRLDPKRWGYVGRVTRRRA